ncbi:MAG TPA: PadR family transcriptional regulator [Fimbriimonadaceae bacterium]|nr:PadR family transcriptional regulator [Fimbriimonadaceae bacterium]
MNRRLSALELTALGVILKRGPCNANSVIREFADSRTLAYRSGAGCIYPLLKRLAEAGLLRCAGKMYTITEAGTAALRAWIKPPFAPLDFATNLDEIRSRAYFLRVLSPDEVREFAAEATKGLEGLLESCRETLRDYQESGDRFSEFAMLGAVRETEARIAWLQELREAVPTTASSPSHGGREDMVR